MPSGTYERHVHLFWRIRLPLYLGLGFLGWSRLRARGFLGGFLLAAAAEAIASYRTPSGTAPVATPQMRDARARQRPPEELRPSPAGWVAPNEHRPAWDWSPPGGMRPRLDRVPGWVRMWYRLPLLDRYAHSWMWWHGGWDVVPPT